MQRSGSFLFEFCFEYLLLKTIKIKSLFITEQHWLVVNTAALIKFENTTKRFLKYAFFAFCLLYFFVTSNLFLKKEYLSRCHLLSLMLGFNFISRHDTTVWG